MNTLANKLNDLLEKRALLDISLSKSLQKSILQEAIQGKLVPQDPNDESASVLLERIRAEKARLVKEGKLKQSALTDSVIFKGDDNRYYERIGKSTRSIDEEIPFDIPKNWEWCRLGNISQLLIGKTPERGNAEYWHNGIYNWVSISDMLEYGHVKTTKEKVSKIADQRIFSVARTQPQPNI